MSSHSRHVPDLLRPHGRGLLLAALLVVSAVLLVAWSIGVPMYEAPDEPAHWQYARYLHDHWQLPVYRRGVEEANSPPLYYALIAPIATETRGPEGAVWRDAAGQLHFPYGPERFKNSRPGVTGYPRLRLARLLTAMISVLTVLVCFLAGREATGSTGSGLLSGGLVLLLPMFTFRGMNISNDALMVLFCAAFTYGCVRLIRRGWHWGTATLTVVALAGAFLSKASAIVLTPMFAMVVLVTTDDWMERLRRVSLLGLGVALAAPYLWRNWVLYGDPLASRAMFEAVPDLVFRKSVTDPYLYRVLPVDSFKSFVGNFGWMSLQLPTWIYRVFAALFALAAVGMAAAWFRESRRRALLVVLVSALPLSLSFLYYINLRFTQPQGRYLFTALPALGVAAAIGYEALPGWRRACSYLLLAALLALNLYILLRIIVPAYGGW